MEKIKFEVINIIKAIFENVGIDTCFVEVGDLVEDLGMDSLLFISIVVDIETKFNIEIPAEKLFINNFKTVDSIVDIVWEELIKQAFKNQMDD